HREGLSAPRDRSRRLEVPDAWNFFSDIFSCSHPAGFRSSLVIVHSLLRNSVAGTDGENDPGEFPVHSELSAGANRIQKQLLSFGRFGDLRDAADFDDLLDYGQDEASRSRTARQHDIHPDRDARHRSRREPDLGLPDAADSDLRHHLGLAARLYYEIHALRNPRGFGLDDSNQQGTRGGIADVGRHMVPDVSES